ncbi:MAG: alanine racemase [Lawsonibacter sp.]|nr:alanine racemase [Lawsonibacter sp.]
MTDRRTVRTWAEIDLDALAHNYRLLRGLAPQAKFLGLVKANAYGHGAVPVAKKLEALGADMLAVACLDEAIELRQAGIVIPILCLGQTPPELVPELLEYDITQTVGDLETGAALSAAAVAAGKTLTIHVKVDTGMGRLGFVYYEDDDEAALERAGKEIESLCALPGLEPEGIFTHFANADGSEAYTKNQCARIYDVFGELWERGLHQFKIYHCAASAAVLNYSWTKVYMNMIRPGIALYGYVPDPSVKDPGLKPVMTVKSRIAAVRDLPAGAKISYGCTATLERDSQIAVLPMGYGDGYPRVLSNQMDMLIRGIPCPIVGRICMDMCMVDVTGLEDVQPGEAAVVYGPKLTQRAAKLAGTIPYELLCQLTPRIPRLYFEAGGEIR